MYIVQGDDTQILATILTYPSFLNGVVLKKPEDSIVLLVV